MGACCSSNREKIYILEGASSDENFCYNAECKLELQKVEFRTFQAAIKRFGYRIQLNEDHLRAIAPEIRLNVDKMLADSNSVYALTYLDTEFAYLEGRHNVDKLMYIGWLLCSHWSEETQSRELWHIANPQLEDTISIHVV